MAGAEGWIALPFAEIPDRLIESPTTTRAVILVGCDELTRACPIAPAIVNLIRDPGLLTRLPSIPEDLFETQARWLNRE